MKFTQFLKDRAYSILIFLFILATMYLLLQAFKIDFMLQIVLISLVTLGFTSTILIEFTRKKAFYDSLLENIQELDKAYLVISTLETPNFYEGKLITEAIYDIGKSMNENVGKLTKNQSDFKEYLEMWIHEVKIPLASLELLIHNHKNPSSKEVQEQLRHIDDYIEQILYYVRQETSENDYIIKEVHLDNILKNIALRNKDALLENDITFEVDGVEKTVETDSKWLEFIVNQLIDNAIKYRDPKKKSHIKVYTKAEKNYLKLTIEDNGIGIPPEDMNRVFDKSFTGQNGRLRNKSTGMGLYIIKNLTNKLGHKIDITSVHGKWTKVTITFAKSGLYDVLK